MKKILLSLRNFIAMFENKPKFEVKEEHQISKAMIIDGVQYYQFADINNMMTGRAFVCMDYYNELNQRCTRDYLEKHCKKVEEILSSGQINIQSLAQMNIQLKERLEMIVDPDIIYKIASVVFFDKSEQPYTYDFKYNQRKIENWKKLGADFFLQIPLKKLIPSLDLSTADLQNYLKAGQAINKKHLEVISTLK